MAERIRVGVVYGGRSSEHAISVVSAGSVLGALDPAKYEVVGIGITRSGAWVQREAAVGELPRGRSELPEVTASSAEVALRKESGEVAVFDTGSAISALDSVDVVLPLLHGRFGEDGALQGLFEMAGIRYVGSGVLASAAAMDKAFTKVVLGAAGIELAPYVLARRGDTVLSADLEHLGLPLFVKPARAGSSVGITKVREYGQLPAALELAFEHDSKVLIEAAVLGRELECGVLEDADGTVSASLPAEIRLHPDVDWYDFDAKYLDDSCDFDIPAAIGADRVREVQELACQVFRELDCAGLARVDCFLSTDGRLVVNEVNTMPGFTPISMYPRMWAETGVSYPELLDRLIATALARE